MADSLTLFKAIADDTRLKILRTLNEKEMYVELLAQRLQLSPPTVSFHLKKLYSAGLIDSKKEQYYTVYSLRRQVFDKSIKELLFDSSGSDAEELREEMYRRKVIDTFMPGGYCERLPAQLKKRLIIYRLIFDRFEPGASYTEKQVNNIISALHGDYCTVRRDMVDMGWFTRKNGVYTCESAAFQAAEDNSR
ncbi:MAG: metalloregulator ArsR/SmtB family transcription factor [Clostridiales bacterium]|nr:metalloregulator ArsR/SmtB family transcription factor [Clostridiales bacterium]